jgi:hypothetical protein
MGRLFEGFEILCADYDHILKKGGIVFKGGHYSRKYGKYHSMLRQIFNKKSKVRPKTPTASKVIPLGVQNHHSLKSYKIGHIR